METASQLETLFFRALEIGESGERSAFLSRSCGDDSSLRAQLDLMLAAQDRRFLSSPPASLLPADRPQGYKPPLPAELAPKFPQLEILDFIGQGGMGAVYKARHVGLDRLLALKVLPPHTRCDGTFVERFTREARAMARLNHPHIVSVYEFGESRGVCYLFMEYVDGVDLRRALASGRIPAVDALNYVSQVCDALQYAHTAGVVHRDVKPENILVDQHGCVKIADFGLAKLVETGKDGECLTGPYHVMGTLRYMAPEQVSGSASVDHRADIYSLGVVFYELLTGEAALGRFPPPSAISGVNPMLDEVVLKSLHREPAMRYCSAADMKTSVETVRNAIHASQTQSQYSIGNAPGAGLRRPSLNPRRQAFLVAAGAIALLAAVTGTPHSDDSTTPSSTPVGASQAAGRELADLSARDSPMGESAVPASHKTEPIVVPTKKLKSLSGEYAAEGGISLYLNAVEDGKLGGRVARSSAKYVSPKVPTREQKSVEAILSGVLRGDSTPLGDAMEGWIPKRWPSIVVNEFWPKHVEKYGGYKSHRILGFDRRTLERPSGLRESLTIWIELEHTKGDPVAIMSFDSVTHELQLLDLDVNESFCPSDKGDAFIPLTTTKFEFGYGGPVLSFDVPDTPSLHGSEFPCTFHRVGSNSVNDSQ